MNPSANQRWSIRRVSLAAWLAVLLALSGQSTAGTPPNALSALEAATVFCHAGANTGHDKPVLPHQLRVAAVLQACLSASHHLAIAARPPRLPRPTVIRIARPNLPPARAPPQRQMASAYARGPPRPV